MMIKTLDNVYINMEDFSGFTIGYPNDSDFTVMAMKELVDNQTATIELGRYPSEKEAKDALKKMIEHQDDIKKAEFFGREEGFYYISNVFTMPKPSKNGKADVKRFMIEGLPDIAEFVKTEKNKEGAACILLEEMQELGAVVGKEDDIPYIIFTKECKENYFRDRFAKVKKMVADMDLDEFSNSDLFTLRDAIQDDWGNMVYKKSFFPILSYY